LLRRCGFVEYNTFDLPTSSNPTVIIVAKKDGGGISSKSP